MNWLYTSRQQEEGYDIETECSRSIGYVVFFTVCFYVGVDLNAVDAIVYNNR